MINDFVLQLLHEFGIYGLIEGKSIVLFEIIVECPNISFEVECIIIVVNDRKIIIDLVNSKSW